ncbi:MAG: type II secretion system protein GspE, partial [Oscillospiraceae bacterium]|nr:type II secretion system protein GspE [Oscillospiraceae bacterium]
DCLEEEKLITEVSLSKALAQKLRVPYVDLNNIDIDAEAVRKIPERFAKKYTVIAITIQGRRLIVATDDPINFNILEAIKMQTGMDAIPVLATKSAINKAIRNMYSIR